MPLLKDFASVALNDAAVVAKDFTREFYGHGPRYSYWNGCSTGGRQGLMLAQRYPTAYDGILANAPAINWPEFIVAEYWPQFVMNQMNTHPPPCVIDAITAAAVKACDGNDGVKDAVISEPSRCQFNASTTVSQKVNCSGQRVRLLGTMHSWFRKSGMVCALPMARPCGTVSRKARRCQEGWP